MKRGHSIPSPLVLIPAMLLCLALAAPLARAADNAPADVGLITRLKGQATYFNEAFQKEPAQARAFMKIRMGDRITLGDGAEIKLVYFVSAVQETWQGPATVVVGLEKSQAPSGGPPPQVQALAANAASGVKRLPALIQNKRSILPGQPANRLSHTGQINVRGVEQDEGPSLKPEDHAQIMSAETAYQKAVQEAAPDDILPELALLGVLGEYRRLRRMETVLEIAYQKQPEAEILKDVEKTVYRSEDYDLFLQDLVELKNPSSPFRLILKLNKARFRQGDPLTLSFTSDRDGYVTILDITTDKRVAVLFPNPSHPDGRVEAGQVYKLPAPDMRFGLEVSGSQGVETLKALALLDTPAFALRGEPGEFFHPLDENHMRELRNLIEKVRQTPTSDWTETSIKFEIE